MEFHLKKHINDGVGEISFYSSNNYHILVIRDKNEWLVYLLNSAYLSSKNLISRFPNDLINKLTSHGSKIEIEIDVSKLQFENAFWKETLISKKIL